VRGRGRGWCTRLAGCGAAHLGKTPHRVVYMTSRYLHAIFSMPVFYNFYYRTTCRVLRRNGVVERTWDAVPSAFCLGCDSSLPPFPACRAGSTPVPSLHRRLQNRAAPLRANSRRAAAPCCCAIPPRLLFERGRRGTCVYLVKYNARLTAPMFAAPYRPGAAWAGAI